MDVITQIKESINLPEFIGERISLKKNGNSYNGTCPFHADHKTPSLHVWENGTWKCFGCNAGSDIFNFQMLYENWEFDRTLKYFCDLLSLEYNDEIRYKADPYIESIRKAKNVEQEIVLDEFDPSIIEDYCNNRHASLRKDGWLEETISHFKLGFCADPLDFLYARITIPVYDLNNRLVFIAGRRVDDINDNKYLFTTDVQKSQILYNLNFALPAIRQKKEMIVLEGYKDCWRMWEAGIFNTVALMGNNPSPQQILMIKKYGAFNIINAMDHDEGGDKGTEKLEIALKSVCQMKRLIFPAGVKDAGEMNPEELKKIYEEIKK